MNPETIAIVATLLLSGSELLALIPSIKANGWIQLVILFLRGIKKWS